MLFIRAHKDVTVIPRLVLSHSTAMPSSLSAVQLHGYTPAIISKIYYQSGSKNIIYVRERDILPNSGHKKSGGFWYWANPDAPDTITSKPEARKLLNSLTKIYFIQHDSDWTSHWEHYWLLDEEFMIIRGMLFVIQSWLFRSSLLLWTVIDNLILGRTQCSQTSPPWPGPEPSSRRLRVGRKQNQWEQ